MTSNGSAEASASLASLTSSEKAGSTEQSRAPFEESTIRPTGVRSPLVRRSTRSASVSVGTGADVAGRVQRLAAERAGGAAGGDDRATPSGEGPGRLGAQDDPQGLHGLLLGLLRVLVMALDDHHVARDVPGEGQRVDAELVLDRRREGFGVAPTDRLGGGALGVRVEQVVDPVGEHGDLDLLERDGHEPALAAGLEEEGAAAGWPDGPGDEALGRVEDGCWHGHHPRSKSGLLGLLASLLARWLPPETKPK